MGAQRSVGANSSCAAAYLARGLVVGGDLAHERSQSGAQGSAVHLRVLDRALCGGQHVQRRLWGQAGCGPVAAGSQLWMSVRRERAGGCRVPQSGPWACWAAQRRAAQRSAQCAPLTSWAILKCLAL